MPETAWGERLEGPYPSVGQGRPGLGARGAHSGVREEKKVALGRALHQTLATHGTAHLDFQLVSHTVFNIITTSRNFPKYHSILFVNHLIWRELYIQYKLKLDRVGPVDNRPSTNKLHHLVKKNVTCDIWHVTCDTWHMTRDMRHVTCDMLWAVNLLSKFQLPSSSGLWVMIFWRLGGKGSHSDWINEWMN